MRSNPRKDRINLLLANGHYQRLSLYLYLATVLLIFFAYLLVISFLEETSWITKGIIAFLSVSAGVFMIYYRDKIVKVMSEKIYERKRRSSKKENVVELSKTIRRITPKNNNLRLNIRGRIPLKDRFDKLVVSFKTKKKSKNGEKEKPDYIEVE